MTYLSNIHLAGKEGLYHLKISDRKIQGVAAGKPQPAQGDHTLEFEDAIAFPGLINSHDHLDFNLFPALGNRIYNDYTEWGTDIHLQNKETIAAVLSIPKELRIRWSLYKNLLNGVTTVVQHGPQMDVTDDLIAVWQEAVSLHSVQLEKGWKRRLLNPATINRPVAIHIGEGTNAAAAGEIDTLLRWNIFRKKLIGIHGVAMEERQAAAFHALVWCPDSNFFLLGRTARIDRLKAKTNILFGTDSTVSSSWNLWEQLRQARKQGLAGDEEIAGMLMSNAARAWGLNGKGTLTGGSEADITVARMPAGSKGWDSFFGLDPALLLLVMRRGKILLFDEEIKTQLIRQEFDGEDFSLVHVGGVAKYVRGDLPGLLKQIRDYYPAAEFPIS